MQNKTDYGNWVPEKLLYGALALAAALIAAAAAAGLWLKMPALCAVLGVLGAAALCFDIYMYICHELFAFGKGDMMAEVHEHLVRHLSWNGEGRLLDIGCGAGALTVRCAKAYPKAELVGMDYWGAEWSYAESQCEANARAEGVAERVSFEKGDAAHLKYADGEFDAAVSNFVFHEVKTAADKREAVREALRVVKKGGAFAFQDLFDQKALYGDIGAFINQLRAEGVSEVNYMGALEDKLGFPAYAKTPWMISGVGLIYGIK